jgi:hypothetical protein
MRARQLSTSALAFLSVLVAGEARADGRFSWRREPGADPCLSEQDLRRRITEIVGHDPFRDDESDRSPSSGADTTRRPEVPTVSGVFRRQGDALVATISLEQPGEAPTSRGFQSYDLSCAPLSEAVALAVALSVERSRDAKSFPSPETRSPAPQPPTEPEARDRHVEPTNRSWMAQAQADWTLGLLPSATTGLGAAVHYRVSDRFSAVLGGLWMPPASERGQFSVGLQAARLGACAEAFRAPPLAFAGCAYGLAGATQVKGEAATTSDAGAHAWWAASASAVASVKLGESWRAEWGAEGAFPFARPVYQTTSCPRIGFQQPPATLGVFLSLGVLFL